jgi:hypothetical protein
VLLVDDQPRGEAVAPEVTGAAALLVEALGVDAVEALHALREQRAGRLDDDVVVRPHQAERVHAPVEAFDHPAEQGEEVAPVVVVEEDERAGDPAGGEVVDAVGEVGAEQPGHPADDRPPELP